MEISPLSAAVREHLRRKKVTVVALAEDLGMNRVTLQSRMTRQNPLMLGNPKDMELVRRVADKIGTPMSEIVETANQLVNAPQHGHDADMVLSLIDILRNPHTSEESKDRAERALLRMLDVQP